MGGNVFSLSGSAVRCLRLTSEVTKILGGSRMRMLTRVQAALAATVMLGAALVAVPAAAAEAAEFEKPVLHLERTEFEAGFWGDGYDSNALDHSVTNVPAGTDRVFIEIGGRGLDGRRVLDEWSLDRRNDEFSWGNVPSFSTFQPDRNGVTSYFAAAYYEVPGVGTSEATRIYSEEVPLTIKDGLWMVAPDTATPAELAAGIELQFKGYLPNERLNGEYYRFDPVTGEWEAMWDLEFLTELDADGTGTRALAIPNAQIGERYLVRIWSTRGAYDGWVSVDVRVVEKHPDTPTPPKKPERVDTGE